jgi:translocation and assembly module TamB
MRRVVRVAATILGGLLALVVVVTVGAFFGLQTHAGGRFLRGIAVGQVNKTIDGRLDIGELEFRGTALRLRNIVLSEPSGEPVLKLAGLSVAYGLRGLLARRVDIREVELDQPELRLRQDAQGTNLSRAIAARHPKPPEPAKKPDAHPGKGWQLNLASLRLVNGAVGVTTVPAAPHSPALHAGLDNLNLASSAQFQTVTKDGELHLKIAGEVNGPGGLSRAPLDIHADIVSVSGSPRGKAGISLGDLLALAATIRSENDGELVIRKVRLPPAMVLALVPSYPVRVPLVLTGTAHLAHGLAATELTLRGEGASGEVVLRGDASLADRQTPHGIVLQAREVKLSQWMTGIPTTAPLVLSVKVSPGSLMPAALAARLDLDVPRTVMAAQAFGPLHLDASLDRGVLERLVLRFPLPGALLTAEGGQRNSRTAINARLAVNRLASVRTAATALGAKPLPILVGSGSVELAALGPHLLLPSPRAPAPVAAPPSAPAEEPASAASPWSVVLRAAMPRLRAGASRYRGIAILASLPYLTPERQSAELEASLKAPFALDVKLLATATEKTTGASPAQAHRTDVELTKLAVDYPGTRWATRNTAHFSMRASGTADAPESQLDLQNFGLYAGAQQLIASLQLQQRGESKNLVGHVELKALRLQDLPPVKNLGKRVAGLLDARVDARGDPARPHVEAKVSLREGRVETFKGLAAEVVATLSEDHTAHGTAQVHAAQLGQLTAKFEGPAVNPPPPRAAVAVSVDVRDVRIAHLPLPPTVGVKADGMVQAHLDVRGTVGDPRVAVRLTGRHLIIDRLAATTSSSTPQTAVAAPLADGAKAGDEKPPGVQQARFDSLSVGADYASPHLALTVTVVDENKGSLHASATSVIPFAELRTPGALAITERKIQGSLRLQNLDPEPLAAFVPSLKTVRGQISAAFEVHGTVAAPELGGEMSWRKGKLVVIPAPPHADKAPVDPSVRTAGP